MAYRRMSGLTKEGRYYSCGVMLINLKKWRECQVEREFSKYISSQRGYTPYFDQSVFNVVCDGKIKLLPLRYNVYTAIIAFDYREFLRLRSLKSFYSQQEYDSARENPVIIHYMGNFFMPMRPWQKNCEHPYADEFMKYRELTPWKDEPLWEDGRSAVQKLYTGFCHSIPRSWAIWISSLVHEHFIPLSHKYKKTKHILKQRRQKS